MSIRDNTSCSELECGLCGKIYKRHSGLAKHKKLIQDANTIRPTIYELPERAIEETRKTLVYHIKERLKQHSKHAGNAHVIVNCTESQFFSVFKGYIHNYYPKTGNY
ncbi:7271_t:CDS:1, partial [Racocetra fulgida]